MRLLRRVPREVYRLYDEEEFLAEAIPEREIPSTPQRPPRLLLGRALAFLLVAGSAMVVAATVLSLAPVARRHRQRVLATSAAPTVGAVAPARSGGTARTTTAARGTERLMEVRDRQRRPARRHRRGSHTAARALPAPLPGPPRGTLPVAVVLPGGQEFGFER